MRAWDHELWWLYVLELARHTVEVRACAKMNAKIARFSHEFAVYSRSPCRRRHRESLWQAEGISWGTMAPWRVKKGPFLVTGTRIFFFRMFRNIGTIPTL